MPFQEQIKSVDGSVTIRNESGKTVPIVGCFDVIVQTGTRQEIVTFLLEKLLGTELIFICTHCDLDVQSIILYH